MAINKIIFSYCFNYLLISLGVVVSISVWACRPK